MEIGAMYPGTFDPITLGHEDLVRRASRIFDKVVVAIARDTGGKVPLFTFEERVDMAEQALCDHGNVEIRGYSGLTVEYARENGLAVIIRGLRAVSDFDYEFQLAWMNRKLDSTMETVFLCPNENYSYVNSSLVKEIARLGGNVAEFVPAFVEKALLERFER